jgi:hypothetical protein
VHNRSIEADAQVRPCASRPRSLCAAHFRRYVFWKGSSILTRIFLAIFFVLLSACASVPRFQSVPPSPSSAEVEVLLFERSSRKLMFVGVFRDGARCRDPEFVFAEAGKTPKYQMRVESKILSLNFMSAGDHVGSPFGPGGITFNRCSSTLTFEPKPQSAYVLEFYDEVQGCGGRLAERVDGRLIDMSHLLRKRDARVDSPGFNRCADEYVPAR